MMTYLNDNQQAVSQSSLFVEPFWSLNKFLLASGTTDLNIFAGTHCLREANCSSTLSEKIIT